MEMLKLVLAEFGCFIAVTDVTILAWFLILSVPYVSPVLDLFPCAALSY